MYKYFPLLFYVTTVLCLKRCQEQSRLYFLIDSTNTTTSRDFGVQIEIVRYILNEYESFKLTLSVQVYHNDQCLNNTNFPSSGFHELSDPKLIKRGLSSLQHISTNYTFDKQCALQMLPSNPIFDSNENRYSIILAKYESLKNIIDKKEHVKFRQGGSYILALMYDNKTEKGVFARRVPNIADMIPAIMKYACPSYAAASTSYEKIAPTSTRYEKIVSHSTAYEKIAPTSAAYKKIISRSTAYKKTASAATLFKKVALMSTTLEKIAPTSTLLENFALTLTTHKKIIVRSPSSKNQISTDSMLRSVLLHGTVSRKFTSDFREVCSTPSLSHLPSNVDVKSSMPLESIVHKSEVVTKSRNKEALSTITPTEVQSQKYNTLFLSGVSTQRSSSASRYVATSKVYSERSLSSLLTSVEYTSSTIKVIPTKSSYTTSIKHKSTYSKVYSESVKISPTMSTLKQYSDSSSYRTSLSTPFFLPSSYIKTPLPATSNKHSVSSDRKTLMMTQSTTVISPSLMQYNTTIGEIQSSLGSSFMSSSNVVFKTVFRQCTTVNKAEKSSIITLPSVTGTLPVYFSTLSRVSPSVLYSTDVISFTNKAETSAMRRSNSSVETTMLKETVSRLLTRSSMFSTQQVVPSSSNKLAYSSTAVVIPAWKRLSKEIDEFIQQNLTDSQLESEEWTKEFINQSSKFFDIISLIKEYKAIKQISVDLVEYIEEVFLKVGKHLPSGGIIKRTEENLDVEISAINTKRFNGYSFQNGQGKNGIVLPKTIFQNFSSDKAVIVGMIFRTPRSFESFNDHFEPAEDIISLSVEPSVEYNLVENPLSYQLQVKENNFSGYKCVFWNNSDWDEYGCRVSHVNGTSVTCNCNHMTSFSVLMQVKEFEIPSKHQFILSLISYIGCGASITACMALILSYMMCGRLAKIDRNIIHINLALAIAIANGLFIAADSVFKYQHICFGVSVAMFYTYLASFFWMLVEGIHVYLMIIKVFKSSRQMRVYMVIGWVLPAIIVTLTAFKFHENFTREDFCWLSLENEVIWVFVGPALFVLVVNTIILIATLNASHKMSVDETEFSRLQRIARLTLLLMPIFGLTWVFGVLAVNKQLLIFQYVFVGINAFQGVFIFICYCLLNNEVKREYQRVRRKSQYSSSKSNGVSENGFSTYIHPYQRRRLKGALSVEDSLAAVQLTKYDTTYPTYYAPDSRREPSENFSDTLTKRLKKQYSIELLQLQQNDADDDTRDVASVCSLLPHEEADFNFRSSTFLDAASNSDKQSTIASEMLEDNTPYKTFHNTNGLVLKAYQV